VLAFRHRFVSVGAARFGPEESRRKKSLDHNRLIDRTVVTHLAITALGLVRPRTTQVRSFAFFTLIAR